MDNSQSHRDSVSHHYDDVKRIWLRFSYPKPDYNDSAYPQFVFEPTYLELNPEFHATLDSKTLPGLADKLLDCAGKPYDHIPQLNHEMAARILCTFDQGRSYTVDNAFNLLNRIPRFPPDLPFDQLTDVVRDIIDEPFPADYLAEKPQEGERILGAQLKVVSLVDGCTMRIALAIAQNTTLSLCHAIKQFLDIVAKLIDMVFERRLENSPVFHYSKIVTIQYLWAMWQRSVTLYLSALLTIQMDSVQLGAMLALSFPALLGLRVVRDAWRGLPTHKSAYMCSWAFELLATSRGSLAFDFRLFHQRFTEAFPNAQPRCTITNETCTGYSPQNCGRFNCKDLVRGDQSLHDESCRGCKRLVWDRNSYLKIDGGRAVDISCQSPTIKYCKTNENTIAISHVWSHGQGGRPDTGINECLHKSYVKMAEDNGCKSYWIDTVCIPNDHNLRREAINHINDTFSDSKITLVCDRDLSSMSAPSGIDDVSQAERLLVTLLVCDWNVRAWTLLEALRGSHSIHIVCAGNKLVSVKELVASVLQKGSLDIAALALTAHHLREKSNIRLKVMDASAMLSHRYATRPGDDVVIWSLMCAIRAGDISSSPKIFWKSKVGFFVNTGYLMSTAPRLEGVKGFGWAPRTPNVRSTDSLLPNSYPSDGSGSEVGRIMHNGLEAIWLYHEVEDGDREKFSGEITQDPDIISAQGQVTAGLNKCWLEVQRCQNLHTRVCLLVAKSQSVGRYFAAEDSHKDYNLVAVAFSDEELPNPGRTYDDEWTWAGVYEWPLSIAMPPLEWENILLF